MCWEATQFYPRDAATPRLARGFFVHALTDLLTFTPPADRFISDAELILSELVTNALNAACTEVAVGMVLHRDSLRLTVEDNAAGAPTLTHASATDEHGRGLAIVAAVAQSWGVSDTLAGKQVWADLDLPHKIRDTIVCDPRWSLSAS